ncbi:hypothetical protein HY311_00395 [Candidatus Nomurabacteria bacterium]|nr:hypothetical protein [Candidatus Nomurabacteria bacterium]
MNNQFNKPPLKNIKKIKNLMEEADKFPMVKIRRSKDQERMSAFKKKVDEARKMVTDLKGEKSFDVARRLSHIQSDLANQISEEDDKNKFHKLFVETVEDPDSLGDGYDYEKALKEMLNLLEK